MKRRVQKRRSKRSKKVWKAYGKAKEKLFDLAQSMGVTPAAAKKMGKSITKQIDRAWEKWEKTK